MKDKPITRLVRLLRLLELEGTRSAKELMKATGASRRTLFRDLESLREAGIEVAYSRRAGGYQLAEPCGFSAGELTSDELVSLVVLAEQVGNDQHVPFFEPAGTAARKLQSNMAGKEKAQLAELAAAITLVPNGVADLEAKSQLFRQLLEARRGRRVLRMRYASLTEWETIHTKLRPYQLIYSRHSWHVIGRSSVHREVRTFKLSRIETLELLDESYTLPRGFSLRRYLGHAWRIIPERGSDLNVAIRFSPLVATNVSEVIWHPTQRLEPQADGSLVFHATVSGVNEISWWILGYADQAEVLRPARLRKLVADRARAMAKMYDR